jgi:hypothetical protein
VSLAAYLALFLGWLRHRVWAIDEKDSDLLIKVLADIHRPVNTGTRFFPLDLTRRDLHGNRITTVAVLNREVIASQNHCHSSKWIAMPRHGLAGGKTQTAHHRGSVMKDDFVRHG